MYTFCRSPDSKSNSITYKAMTINEIDPEGLFIFKVRIIGYYSAPNQDMLPETEAVHEAEVLALLFEKSFASLLTGSVLQAHFREVLTGNSIFILRDFNKHLYAYYPLKRRARITSVKYDCSAIRTVPLIYKSSFMPGEIIPLLGARPVKTEHLRVFKSGSGFTLKRNGKTLPLYWQSDKNISCSNLGNYLRDPWVEIHETDSVNYAANPSTGNNNLPLSYHIRPRQWLIEYSLQPAVEVLRTICHLRAENPEKLFAENWEQINRLACRCDKVFTHLKVPDFVAEFRTLLVQCEALLRARGEAKKMREEGARTITNAKH